MTQISIINDQYYWTLNFINNRLYNNYVMIMVLNSITHLNSEILLYFILLHK